MNLSKERFLKANLKCLILLSFMSGKTIEKLNAHTVGSLLVNWQEG
jgi:hypothetical protein